MVFAATERRRPITKASPTEERRRDHDVRDHRDRHGRHRDDVADRESVEEEQRHRNIDDRVRRERGAIASLASQLQDLRPGDELTEDDAGPARDRAKVHARLLIVSARSRQAS
jgi:hypothetical protein